MSSKKEHDYKVHAVKFSHSFLLIYFVFFIIINHHNMIHCIISSYS